MKKLIAVLLVVVLVFGLAACGGSGTSDEEGPHVLRVGLVGAFNVHWDTIAEIVAEDNIELELVYFTDFAIPNRALNEGDIDLNAFQHKMFLANDSEANGYELQTIAETFIAPLNLFNNRDRISSLADIQDGHTIAIPSDPTNGGRALRLLENAGLITLNTPEGQIPSILDVTEIVQINILEAESGMLFNILPDVEAAVITATNALSAGLRPEEDSIFEEDITGSDVSELINIIVARSADVAEGGLRAELFDIIVRAHHSERVRQVILDEYQGALIPVW